MNANVLEAIKRSAAIPSVPQVVMRFLEVIQDPAFDYDDLVRVLSVDPGTVSEVLRLTNSALFGISREITSLRQALTLLGPKRTRSLVLGRYLVESLGDTTAPDVDPSYFWRRSLASAVLSARFADRTLRRQREDAFIGGLLADIGIPILAQAMPVDYGPIAVRYAPHGRPISAEDERAAVEATHGEVSAMVLSHWGLPSHVCRAVNCHDHQALVGDDLPTAMARLVAAADRIARLLCEVPDVSEIATVCAQSAVLAGIELADVADILSDIERDVEELANILRIDVIPSSVYAMIAKTIQDKLTAPATT
ncbi:MAG: HDOD domain-containing protein [bacterium]|nr:HDOD domain-containing protein [bacterium]